MKVDDDFGDRIVVLALTLLGLTVFMLVVLGVIV